MESNLNLSITRSNIEELNYYEGQPSSEDDDIKIPDSNLETDSSNDARLFYNDKKGEPKVLVIANYEFGAAAKKLSGHQNDLINLEDMWEQYFEIKIECKRNMTAANIREATEVFSKQFDGDERYCAVFILSHGNGDGMLGKDGKIVTFNEILSKYDNENKNLQNIPKLFFFICCSDEELDKGVSPAEGTITAGNDNSTLPKVSDRMIMLAIQCFKVAFLEGGGSLIAKAIIEVFIEYHKQEDLTSMLTIVNERISDKVATYAGEKFDRGKCMSEYVSTLRAKLSMNNT